MNWNLPLCGVLGQGISGVYVSLLGGAYARKNSMLHIRRPPGTLVGTPASDTRPCFRLE